MENASTRRSASGRLGRRLLTEDLRGLERCWTIRELTLDLGDGPAMLAGRQTRPEGVLLALVSAEIGHWTARPCLSGVIVRGRDGEQSDVDRGASTHETVVAEESVDEERIAKHVPA